MSVVNPKPAWASRGQHNADRVTDSVMVVNKINDALDDIRQLVRYRSIQRPSAFHRTILSQRSINHSLDHLRG